MGSDGSRLRLSRSKGSGCTGGGGEGGRCTILIRGVFEFERGARAGGGFVAGVGGAGVGIVFVGSLGVLGDCFGIARGRNKGAAGEGRFERLLSISFTPFPFALRC